MTCCQPKVWVEELPGHISMEGHERHFRETLELGQRSISKSQKYLFLAKGVDGRTAWDIAAWKGKKEIVEEEWSLGRELQVDQSVAKNMIVLDDGYLKKFKAVLLFLNVFEHLLDCLQDNTWILETVEIDKENLYSVLNNNLCKPSILVYIQPGTGQLCRMRLYIQETLFKCGERKQHPDVLKNKCFPAEKWTDELPLPLQ